MIQIRRKNILSFKESGHDVFSPGTDRHGRAGSHWRRQGRSIHHKQPRRAINLAIAVHYRTIFLSTNTGSPQRMHSRRTLCRIDLTARQSADFIHCALYFFVNRTIGRIKRYSKPARPDTCHAIHGIDTHATHHHPVPETIEDKRRKGIAAETGKTITPNDEIPVRIVPQLDSTLAWKTFCKITGSIVQIPESAYIPVSTKPLPQARHTLESLVFVPAVQQQAQCIHGPRPNKNVSGVYGTDGIITQVFIRNFKSTIVLHITLDAPHFAHIQYIQSFFDRGQDIYDIHR